MKPQFIEFDRETMRPFSMYDGKWQFDVEYHREGDQLYLKESSGGPPYLEGSKNFWWAIEGLRPDIYLPSTGQRHPAPLKNRIELPQKYEDTGEPADIETWAYYGGTVACEVCQDWIPEEDLCEHLKWDEEKGEYVTRAEGID